MSLPPQAAFVRGLLGADTPVLVLLPAGANPTVYEPTPQQAQQLSQARIYFRAGVPFEDAWLKRLLSVAPKLRVVDLNRDLPMKDRDPHTWLSPPLVSGQLETMRLVLRQLYPQQAGAIDARHRTYSRSVMALHRRLLDRLTPYRGRTLLSVHPTWNYFASTYHLRLLVVEDHGRERGPAEMAQLIRQARQAGVRDVFTQAEFDRRPATVLAQELGGQVRVARPLDANWEASLETFAAQLVESFGDSTAPKSRP